MIRTFGRGRASHRRRTATANNAIWNYIYADAPTDCTTLGNSVERQRPDLHQGRSLPVEHGADQRGYTVLQVGGTLTLNNSSHVGTAQRRSAEVHVGGGCQSDTARSTPRAAHPIRLLDAAGSDATPGALRSRRSTSPTGT